MSKPNKVIKFYRWILSLTYLKFELLALAACFSVSFITTNLLMDVFNVKSVDFKGANLQDISIGEQLLIIIFLAPFLETILLQTLPILIVKRITNKDFLASTISALCFALMHTYNFIYFIATLLSGIVLGYTYIFSIKRKEYAIFNVFLVHSMYNTIAFIIKYFN